MGARTCPSGSIHAQPWSTFPANVGLQVDSYNLRRWKEKVVTTSAFVLSGRMRTSLNECIQAQPQMSFPAGVGVHMDSYNLRRWKEKVVVVMGATGTGKSRLSIDLATHFPAEIVNSDKMQVYRGLDIVTNKVTSEERKGIPHHLLGDVGPETDFTALDFRHSASLALEVITMRGKLPIIAGGSNSYIEALIEDEHLQFRSKYDCYFLWVDVDVRVLYSFLSERVDRMVEAGLVEEVRNNFDRGAEADYSHGIQRAIGLPELDRYLRLDANANEEKRARLLEEAIDEIKANTCKLACCQVGKIHGLRARHGWDIHRIDATEVFLKSGKEADLAWEMLVARPSISGVADFLYEKAERDFTTNPTCGIFPTPVAAPVMAASARWWGPQIRGCHNFGVS